jgi:hypothetical protein
LPMTCVYCLDRRGDPRKSLEHIWPQSLGGKFAPAIFKTDDVCVTCNSIAGLWVDGAFLKSWFISHEHGNSARMFLDPQAPGATPLRYMGIVEAFPVQPGEVAELWFGDGCAVYHVHLADGEKWYGYAGGDILRRKVDRGRAYFALQSQNQYWAAVALLSFIAGMDGPRLIPVPGITGLPPSIVSKLVQENEMMPVERAERTWIREQGPCRKVTFAVRQDFSKRFLAKLALGLGSNLFGASFLRSRSADELRTALWFRETADTAEDELPQVYGIDYFNDSPLSRPGMGIPGAWTIALGGRPAFALGVWSPGGKFMAIKITHEPELTGAPECADYRSGVFYFVVPQRGIFAGPVSMLNYIQHKRAKRVDPTIAAIERMRVTRDALPPLELPDVAE